MDQQDNRDISQQWDDLLKDAFGSTEATIDIDTDAEPVKEDPTVTPSAQEEPVEIILAPEAPAKRPLYRRLWFWLILIALAALLGVAAWFFLGKDAGTEPITPEDSFMQKALDQCKAGLAQWQAMDSYYVTQNTLFYGDNMGGATRGEFWCSGDNYLQIQYWSGGHFSGWIKHNGVIYSARSDIHPVTGNNWATLDEDVATEFLAPWPMSFDLDSSEIVNIIGIGNASASGGGSHYTSISFSVLCSDSESVFMYPCDVNFTFDVYGNLQSVTLVDAEPREAERTGISVITYRLETPDYDIAQFIAEAPSQPLTFVQAYSPVPLPE